jgi:hypothetical protein
MPFRMFGKKRKKDNGVDLIEMGPEQEDDRGPTVAPGQPVPYEADSWSPPSEGDGGLYQSGSAVLTQCGPDPYKVVVHSEVMEKTHVVHEPRGMLTAPDAGVDVGKEVTPPSKGIDPEVREAVEAKVDYSMVIQCPDCQAAMRVPRRRPIRVTCPCCGAKGDLR